MSDRPTVRRAPSRLVSALLLLWFGAMLFMIVPRETRFEFDRLHFAFRRSHSLAGFRFHSDLLTVNSTGTEQYFTQQLAPERQHDWQKVGAVYSGLLSPVASPDVIERASEYRWLCQGLREMCDFCSYGDFGSMSGKLDAAGRSRLVQVTGEILDSEGPDAANRYLIFAYEGWIRRGGGREALHNNMLSQQLSAEDVPVADDFAVRNSSGDNSLKDWWPRYEDLMTMICRED